MEESEKSLMVKLVELRGYLELNEGVQKRMIWSLL